MKISVIVPVYNVEKYIERCLESISNQTLKDIEILVINDGSKDGSGKIVDQLAINDKRIKHLKKPNGGLSDARNYGIKHAKGEYISLVDGDDFIETDMLEKMYDSAKKHSADIVQCQINDYYSESDIRKGYFKSPVGSYDIKNYPQNLFLSCPVAWDKIYRRELFIDNEIEFPVGKKYEDVGTIPKLMIMANKIVGIDDYLINYVQREGSITSVYDSSVFEIQENIIEQQQWLIQHNMYDQCAQAYELFAFRHMVLTLRYMSKQGIKGYTEKQAQKIIQDRFDDSFADFKNNILQKHLIKYSMKERGILSALKMMWIIKKY